MGRPSGRFVAALAALLIVPAGGSTAREAPSWCLLPDESAITFTGTQTGREFEGHFEDFSAEIHFDPDNLAASEVTVTIRMASVEAGNKDRNEALPNSEWFHVGKYPTATFTAGEFVPTNGTTFDARGSLTIRGNTQDITLPFDLDISDSRARATGAVTIDRRDYGVGQGMWTSDRWVAYPVRIGMDVVAERCSE